MQFPKILEPLLYADLQVRSFKNEQADMRLRKQLSETNPDYFVIIDLNTFEKEVALGKFLDKNFPIKKKNEDYIVYDLNRPRQ